MNWKLLSVLGFIASTVNSVSGFLNSNIDAGMGWATSAILWLSVVLEEFKSKATP